MADPNTDWNRIPVWCIAAPIAGALVFALKSAGLAAGSNPLFLIGAVACLGAAVFAAVHFAETLAVRIGQPFGAILLALSITALEVGLIISVMASGSAGSEVVARDTVFAVTMIVLNGIVGICLVVGGLRHYEQEFRVQGASATLSVIATFAVIALILPNFTTTTVGPVYAPNQLMFVGTVSLILYAVFIFVQTVRHRADFLFDEGGGEPAKKPGRQTTILSAIFMIASLGVVILLAKVLSPTLERSIIGAGLPLAVVGVVIAMITLLPEGVTALKAARSNRLQTSLNASLGSAAASIGLTIPIVGVASIVLGQTPTLGLPPQGMVLLALTLLLSILTFATGRTTIIQGAVHLVVFGVFLFLSAVP